jgi:hypothetical protein
MTPQQIIRRDVILMFLAAAALGFAVWAAAPWLVDRREPWDADWPFYSATLVLGGTATAWCQPKQVAATYVGVWLGQVAALALLPAHAGGWLPLGAVTTGIGSLFALFGAVLGNGLRRLSRK